MSMNRMRQWAHAAMQVVGLTVLVLAGVALVLLVIDLLPWIVSWNVWEVLTAIGTVGATLVAVVLALRAWLQERDSAARVVSAWITDEYQPRDDGSSYRRSVQLYVANESNQPVFNARVNVHVGRFQTPLGPLSAPAPISVVPPRRELVFDISIPLLGHPDSWNPKATLTFTDPKGNHWLRGLDGELRNVSRQRQRWSKRERPADDRQLGDMESVFNPMLVAFAFLACLRDSDISPEDLANLVASEAPGWANVDWAQLRRELEDHQPTSMVDYPAPRIARVKLSADPRLAGKSVEGVGRPLELAVAKFMTLTLDPLRGWRVFGMGPSVRPDAIYFASSLIEEVQPFQVDSVCEPGVAGA